MRYFALVFWNMEKVKEVTPDAEYARNTFSSTTSRPPKNIIAKEIGLSAVTLNK